MRLGAIEFVLRLKDDFTKVLKKASSKSKKTAKKVSTDWKKASLAIKAAWVAIGYVIVKVFKDIISKTMTAEQAMARLVQQLKNQSIYTEENVEAFKRLANQLQELTGISNDEIISTIALAASYKLNARQLQEVLPSLLDLAAFTAKASGGQRDLESTVILMGYALKGAVGRLEMMGITFSDVQKEMLKTGDRAQRLNIFMQAVTDNAGDVAKAMGETAAGQIEVFRQALSDLEKEIGTVLLPSLGRLASFTVRSMKRVRKDLAIMSSDLFKLKTLIETVFTKKTIEDLRKEWELYDLTLKSILDEIDGIGDIILEETRKGVEGAEDLEKSFEELKKQTMEYQRRVGDLDLQWKAGLITQEQYNITLKKIRDSYGDVISEIDKVNTALDTTTKKTINYVDAIAEQFGTKGLAAVLKDTGTLIEEVFRKAQEAGGETTEAIDEMIEKAEERGVVILRESDRISKAEEKTVIQSQNINEEIGTNFIKAVEKSQPARNKFIQDITDLKQVLIDSQIELAKLNAMPLDSKTAEWNVTINVTRVVTTVAG